MFRRPLVWRKGKNKTRKDVCQWAGEEAEGLKASLESVIPFRILGQCSVIYAEEVKAPGYSEH